MDSLGNKQENQVTDEQHSPYVETTQSTGAVIDTQPTYVHEAHVESRRSIPFATIENRTTSNYFPEFHRTGIDVLGITDQLLIQQTVELLDLIASVESENRYLIKIPRGDTLFEAAEKSSGWQRAIFGSARSYVLRIFDRSRREVIQINRRTACSCCFLYCCCFQGVRVYSPPATFLGSIEQEWSLFIPTFRIKNHVGDIIYKIEGSSAFMFSGSTESTFKILTYDGTREVGSIINQWNDLQLQHNLRVIFPFEETANMRAVILGAAFLMQYMFFETSKKAHNIRFSTFNNP